MFSGNINVSGSGNTTHYYNRECLFGSSGRRLTLGAVPEESTRPLRRRRSGSDEVGAWDLEVAMDREGFYLQAPMLPAPFFKR